MRKSSKDEEFHITSRRSAATRQLAYFAGDTLERREFKFAPHLDYFRTHAARELHLTITI